MFKKSKIYFLISVLSLFFLTGFPSFAQSPRKVVCLGDSITVGYHPNFRTPDGQPCTRNARVGRPTSEMVSEWRRNIKNQGFTDLILMGGTNDVVGGRCSDPVTSVATDRAIANLQTIYNEAKASGMRVIALTIPPAAGLTNYGIYRCHPSETQQNIDNLNAFVRSSPVDAVIDAYQLLGDPARPTFLNPTLSRPDGLHPNDAGATLLAQTISAQGFGGAAPSGAPVSVPEKPIITPKLSINIPTVNFSQAVQQGNILFLPFLADYITGLYKYLLAIVGILAGIMLTIGGVKYLTSGGSTERVGSAKETIRNALIGLVIALGSYVILFTINPQLVKFSSLQVELVRGQQLEFDGYSGINYGGSVDETQARSTGTRDCMDPRTPSPPQCRKPGKTAIRTVFRDSSFTGFDNLFQRYAGCLGIDWRILKAFAYKESQFDEGVQNCCGFKGLFQTAARFCTAGEACQNLFDPENNTKAIVLQHRPIISTIKSKCSGISTDRFVALLYIGHNSGIGALTGVPGSKGVIERVGCNGDLNAGVAAFWADYRPNTPNASGRGGYAQSVARQAISYGVQNPFVQGSCPF